MNKLTRTLKRLRRDLVHFELDMVLTDYLEMVFVMGDVWQGRPRVFWHWFDEAAEGFTLHFRWLMVALWVDVGALPFRNDE